MASRKVALGAAAAGVYGITAVGSYYYMSGSRRAAAPPCSCCGGGAPFSKKSAAQYDKIASAYDAKISSDEFVMGVGLLRKHLIGSRARGKVLEVASGTGRNLDCYKFRDGDVPWWLGLFGTVFKGEVSGLVMAEKSTAMVEVARDKVLKMPHIAQRVRVDVGDCTDLSRYPDESFDTVVDTFGLCSFSDPVKALREMQRVCRRDGRILLLEHGRTNNFAWLDKMLDDGRDQHVEKWGCEWNRDIDEIVRSSNLDVEWSAKWHFGTTTVVSGKRRTE
mmetsp:Transcript_10960/g.21806  ORF Transcript_10960/g.21806 Transcript_10960/m.21806 type:complete len:277 (+) Transcript_10960:110-940(+)